MCWWAELDRRKASPLIATALPAAPGISGPLSFGINSTGQIVGGYFDPASVRQPFLLSGGTYTTLIPTGAFATGINDAGQIVLTIFGTIEFPF